MAVSTPRENEDLDDPSAAIFADINVTPLVDIMLVLLIIFMVSTTVMTEDNKSSGIKVDLPKATAKGGAQQDADVIVALTKEGQIVHEGTTVSLEQLREVLLAAKKKSPETVIIVQADKEVMHGKVTDVLDLARSLGLEHLSIATEAPE
jgi:biopolymer transport protein ExbD